MNKEEITVIICCAGMGTRLGIGTPKALLDINGKPLIIRQLELLKDYSDIRIVVGYKAEEVIKTVLNYRKDIMFAFNYNYENSSIVDSIKKASINSRKYIVEIDGDILINHYDLKKILEFKDECIAYNYVNSNEPVYVELKDNKIISFNKNKTNYEMLGIVKYRSDKLIENDKNLYFSLMKYLPIEGINVNARDIDTQDDYIEAIKWYNCSK